MMVIGCQNTTVRISACPLPYSLFLCLPPPLRPLPLPAPSPTPCACLPPPLRGSKLIELPYVVKGMDVSFSVSTHMKDGPGPVGGGQEGALLVPMSLMGI